jgi:hypothetical protein
MKHQLSREAFLARFGAVQANSHWAWSAVNHDERTCYFSAWVDLRRTDENGDKYYVVQEPQWGRADSPSFLGRNDQDRKFDLALNQGYSSRLYFVEAEDTKAEPRSIKSTKTSSVFDAVLVKTDSEIRAYPHPLGRVSTPQ